MKQSLMVLLLAVSLILGLSFESVATPSNAQICVPKSTLFGKGGGADPWPWGAEILFPWKDIAGVWIANIKGCPHYYSFRVLRSSDQGERILSVQEIDPINCQIIAKGLGYEQNRVVKAVVTGKRGQIEINIRAFKPEDVKGLKVPEVYENAVKQVTMISINKVGQPRSREMSALYRLGDDPSVVCGQDDP